MIHLTQIRRILKILQHELSHLGRPGTGVSNSVTNLMRKLQDKYTKLGATYVEDLDRILDMYEKKP